MKVYLGIMRREGKLAAVFWMANPENLIAVPLDALSVIGPVVGTLSYERGYEPLPADHWLRQTVIDASPVPACSET